MSRPLGKPPAGKGGCVQAKEKCQDHQEGHNKEEHTSGIGILAGVQGRQKVTREVSGTRRALFPGSSQKLPHARASLLFQLWVGYAPLQAHLYLLRAVETAVCPHCGDAPKLLRTSSADAALPQQNTTSTSPLGVSSSLTCPFCSGRRRRSLRFLVILRLRTVSLV